MSKWRRIRFLVDRFNCGLIGFTKMPKIHKGKSTVPVRTKYSRLINELFIFLSMVSKEVKFLAGLISFRPLWLRNLSGYYLPNYISWSFRTVFFHCVRQDVRYMDLISLAVCKHHWADK